MNLPDEDEEEWDLSAPPRSVTLVVAGRTGNGKSATGNSILGFKAFESKLRSGSVTETSQIKSATLPDGRSVQVVDTPGFFDPKTPLDFIGKEIVKCIELAKEGFHAVLLVLSLRNRFTPEEFAATELLQALFGAKIIDYMIVVFTGGDELEEDIETYLKDNAPPSLLDLLEACKGRRIVFDNKTTDQYKKNRQVTALIGMVDQVLDANGGLPFSNDLFEGAKKLATEYVQSEKLRELPGFLSDDLRKFREEIQKAQQEQLQSIISLLEEKMRIQTEQLENHLKQEKIAREALEQSAKEAEEKAKADIQNLRDELQKANREREELNEKYARHSQSAGCMIL